MRYVAAAEPFGHGIAGKDDRNGERPPDGQRCEETRPNGIVFRPVYETVAWTPLDRNLSAKVGICLATDIFQVTLMHVGAGGLP